MAEGLWARCKQCICMDEPDSPGKTVTIDLNTAAGNDTQVIKYVQGEIRGISILKDYNRDAKPVPELVDQLVTTIQQVETNFTIHRIAALGKGAAGTVQLCRCRNEKGEEDVVALKELAKPEVWRLGDPQMTLRAALDNLPLEEAAFQTVLTHENIVEIYWADVAIINRHTREPIPVRWKHQKTALGTLSGRSFRQVNRSLRSSTSGASGDSEIHPYLTLKMLLSRDRDQLELPKEIGLNMRIAMEYCELGALVEHLQTRNNKPEPVSVLAGNMDGTMCAALTALDVANSLKLLHRNKIVHGDVKPHNILLSKRGVKRSQFDPRGFRAKLSDFGMSVLQMEEDTEVKKGSVEYMPHVNFQEARVSFSTDVYALGIVMWELWHNQLWEEKYRQELNQQRFGVIDMSNVRPRCNSTCPAQYRDIVESCLQPDDQRPSIRRVVQALDYLCSAPQNGGVH